MYDFIARSILLVSISTGVLKTLVHGPGLCHGSAWRQRGSRMTSHSLSWQATEIDIGSTAGSVGGQNTDLQKPKDTFLNNLQRIAEVMLRPVRALQPMDIASQCSSDMTQYIDVSEAPDASMLASIATCRCGMELLRQSANKQ